MDGAVLLWLGEMRSQLRPVAILLWRRNSREHLRFDARHVPEQLFYLACFPLQLGFVGKVLILASAALTKYRTRGVDAIRRRFQHRHKIRFGKVLFVSVDSSPDPFAGQCIPNHDDPVIVATQPLAHVGEGLYIQINLFVVRVGVWLKSSGNSGSMRFAFVHCPETKDVSLGDGKISEKRGLN